jgi:hypothetical protein
MKEAIETKILAAKVEWFNGCANSPQFKLLVDKIPSYEERIYDEKRVDAGTLYFAEQDGFVDFMYHTPRNENGYGGRKWTIKVRKSDGNIEERVVKGPWSSNSPAMNGAGFHPSVECTITDEPDVWKRGFTFYAGHVTYELAQEAAKMCGVPLVLVKYGKCGMMLSAKQNTVVTFGLELPKDGSEFAFEIPKSAMPDDEPPWQYGSMVCGR